MARSLNDQINFVIKFIDRWEKNCFDKVEEGKLCTEWQEFAKAEGLPQMSADELLCELYNLKRKRGA